MGEVLTIKNESVTSDSIGHNWMYRASIELAQQVPIYIIEDLSFDIVEGDGLGS